MLEIRLYSAIGFGGILSKLVFVACCKPFIRSREAAYHAMQTPLWEDQVVVHGKIFPMVNVIILSSNAVILC